MEVAGSATQTIRVHLAACQQTEQDAVVAQLIKSYSYCMSQDRQLMQIQKLVLGPKFGAHIVEKFNDQGLNTLFMSQGRVVYDRRGVAQY